MTSSPSLRASACRLVTLLVAAFLAASLVVFPRDTAAGAEITVRHASGETVLKERPRTVLVFDPGALDTLDALGVDVAGVPGSTLPDALARYRDKRYLKIGSLFEPDFEAVAAAEPDLIIVAARSSPRYAELARIAPTIDLTIDPAAYLDGVRRNVGTLARIFGKEAEGAALLAALDTQVARVRAAAPAAGTVQVVMVSGGRLTTYGPGSRFGWLFGDVGLTPAVPRSEAATHGEAISFEFLVKTDPDWLIVLDRDAAIGQAGASARKVLDNELVAATRAAKAGRILYVESGRWYIIIGGVASFRTAVEQLADVLEAQGGK